MPTLYKYLILIGLMVLFGANQAFALSARIEAVGRGDQVKVTRSGATIHLKKDDLLQSGDELVTDAQTSVDLRLEDETLIRVGVNSTYKVQEDSKIHSLVHRLLSGIVRVLVPKSDKKESNIKFRMYTSEGTIGVRGTEFVVIRKDGATQLRGLDGEVMFGPPETAYELREEFVMVDRGFKSEIKAGEKAHKPEKFNLQQYIDELGQANGPFGPLANRQQPANTHARGNTSAASSQGVAMNVPSEKHEDRAKVIPASHRDPKDKVDYQQKLFEAALEGNQEEAEDAFKHRVNMSAKSVEGYTPLHYALDGEKQDMFLFLIQHGADVDALDKDGHTPLMFVAINKLDMKYALALVHPGGADVDFKNKKGETASSIAKANGYKELYDYLEGDQVIKDFNEAQEENKARAEKADKKPSKKNK